MGGELFQCLLIWIIQVTLFWYALDIVLTNLVMGFFKFEILLSIKRACLYEACAVFLVGCNDNKIRWDPLICSDHYYVSKDNLSRFLFNKPLGAMIIDENLLIICFLVLNISPIVFYSLSKQRD